MVINLLKELLQPGVATGGSDVATVVFLLIFLLLVSALGGVFIAIPLRGVLAKIQPPRQQ